MFQATEKWLGTGELCPRIIQNLCFGRQNHLCQRLKTTIQHNQRIGVRPHYLGDPGDAKHEIPQVMGRKEENWRRCLSHGALVYCKRPPDTRNMAIVAL